MQALLVFLHWAGVVEISQINCIQCGVNAEIDGPDGKTPERQQHWGEK